MTGLRVFTCRDGFELLAQRALQARQVDGLDQVQATGFAPLHHHAAVQQELHALQSRDFIPLPLVQPRGLQPRQQRDASMVEAWGCDPKASKPLRVYESSHLTANTVTNQTAGTGEEKADDEQVHQHEQISLVVVCEQLVILSEYETRIRSGRQRSRIHVRERGGRWFY